MSKRTTKSATSLHEVAQAVGRYPEPAFRFVRAGLEYAARAAHGAVTPAQWAVARYMAEEAIDLQELIERYERGDLDPEVAGVIRKAGGIEMLNRNVRGQDLCWALRDLALRQWGALATLVLSRWNIRRTEDFGAIVFALVDHGFMQKEPHDSLGDFKDVYDFDEAFVHRIEHDTSASDSCN